MYSFITSTSGARAATGVALIPPTWPGLASQTQTPPVPPASWSHKDAAVTRAEHKRLMLQERGQSSSDWWELCPEGALMDFGDL